MAFTTASSMSARMLSTPAWLKKLARSVLDHRVYPIQGLSLPAFIEYAAGGDLLAKVADHVPDELMPSPASAEQV